MNAIQRSYTTSTGKVNTITLVKGDIAQVPAQAILIPINSGGMWWGALDGVIETACGVQRMSSADQFHQQLKKNLRNQIGMSALAGTKMIAKRDNSRHGQVYVCRKQTPHRGLFQDVIFIIDDLEGPVSDLTFNILAGTSEAGYTDVSLPAFRTGVMKGAYEPTPEAAVAGILEGLTSFYDQFPDSNLSNITFVIYDGGKVLNLLQSRMKKFSYRVWAFFRIWKLNYLVRKAQRSIEAMRKFTAGHVTVYPYSMVFAALNEDIAEATAQIALLQSSQTYDEFLLKYEERELQKTMDRADVFMKEAEDFLASLGDLGA